MTQQPKVSVIIPVYNVEEYLPKCLDSVINQTLKDIEIICINDGSTDNSLGILNDYASKDNRIIVIDKKNEGVSVARNKGLEIAQGEYITFLDSDDWFELNAMELAYNKITNDKSDMLVFDFYTVKSDMKKPSNTLDKLDENKIFSFFDCPDDFFYVMTAVWGKIWKKNNILFNPNLSKGEDTVCFWQNCLKNYKISILKERLYNYFQRQNSAMHDLSIINKCEVFKAIKALISLDCFKKAPLHTQIHILDRFAQSIWWELHILPKKHKLSNLYKKEYQNFNKLFKEYDSKMLESLRFRKKMKNEYNKKNIKFYKKIFSKVFSINKSQSGRHNIIYFLGLKLKINILKNKSKEEERWLRKIKKKQHKFPKDTYLLMDNLEDKETEPVDAYSLFEFMRNYGYNAYYVIRGDGVLYEKLKKENKTDNIIPVNYNTRINPDIFIKQIYGVLLRTKCVISSFATNSIQLEKFFKDNQYWKYIFLQHGITYFKISGIKNGYLAASKFDKILVTSECEESIFVKHGWLKEQIIKVGFPRWDLLKENKRQEKSILLMFTWRRISKDDFQISMYKKNILSLLNNKTLQEYLTKYNVKLYLAPHHALKTLCRVDFDVLHPNVEIINPQNISKYIKKCSMLVTDFSSVVFDFMFQDKPVICYGLDIDDKILKPIEKEDLQGLKDKQQEFPNILFDEESVINKIKYYVENDFKVEEENLKKYEKFFYTKENIREKLTNELEKICNE